MNNVLHSIRTSALGRALASPRGWRFARGLRWVLLAGVVVWLVQQLAGLGWREVWEARPRTPWFYVLWLLLYLQLPTFETAIFGRLWKTRMAALVPPILRKRALNQDVVSYSGEAYFFVWAQRRLGLAPGLVAGTLKDNAIASSLASWASVGLLVALLGVTGQVVVADLIGPQEPLVVVGVGAAVAVVLFVGYQFRRAVFTLAPRTVVWLFGAHVVRFFVVGYGLQILQWWLVLPEAPLYVWATILAVLSLVNRLPLLPAKDLVGIGAVLGMSGLLEASAPVIAAMLLMKSALDKTSNVLLFVGTLALDRLRPPEAVSIEVADGRGEPADPSSAVLAEA